MSCPVPSISLSPFRVTGFTSDFHSFIVVDLIPFFHAALQLCADILNERQHGLQYHYDLSKLDFRPFRSKT